MNYAGIKIIKHCQQRSGSQKLKGEPSQVKENFQW